MKKWYLQLEHLIILLFQWGLLRVRHLNPIRIRKRIPSKFIHRHSLSKNVVHRDWGREETSPETQFTRKTVAKVILSMIIIISTYYIIGYPIPFIFGTWPSGWRNRKSHVLNATTGTGLNYQVKVTVHFGSGTDSGDDVYCNSKCRTDFGDVRWYNDDEVTEEDYWIESKTDGVSADFWIEPSDNLGVGADVTIYLYYANAGVTTTSDGQSTFIFFDDFIYGVTIENTVEQTEEYDCYGNACVYLEDSDTAWIYYQRYKADNLYDLARIVYTISTDTIESDTVLWVDATHRVGDVPQIVKLGSTYYLTYCTNEGANYSYEARTSADGLNWSDPTVLDTGSEMYFHQSVYKLSESVYWIFYPYQTGASWAMKRIVFDGSYGSPATVFTEGSWIKDTGLYYEAGRYYLYYGMGLSYLACRTSTNGTTFGDRITIGPDGFGNFYPTVEKIGSTYYMIFIDDNDTNIELWMGNSPLKLNYVQTLHAGTARAPNFLVYDTDKILMVYSKPSEVERGKTQIERIELADTVTAYSYSPDADRWDIKSTPTITNKNDIIEIVSATTDWKGIMSNVGGLGGGAPPNIAFRTRARNSVSSGMRFEAGLVEGFTTTHGGDQTKDMCVLLCYADVIYLKNCNDNACTSITIGDETDDMENFHIYDIRCIDWKTMIYRDNVLWDNNINRNPNERLHCLFCSRDSQTVYADYVAVRKVIEDESGIHGAWGSEETRLTPAGGGPNTKLLLPLQLS